MDIIALAYRLITHINNQPMDEETRKVIIEAIEEVATWPDYQAPTTHAEALSQMSAVMEHPHHHLRVAMEEARAAHLTTTRDTWMKTRAAKDDAEQIVHVMYNRLLQQLLLLWAAGDAVRQED